MKPIALLCHQLTPIDAVDRLDAQVRRQPSSVLLVTFTLTGDLAGVRIPRAAAPRIADRLWEHTCFEVFVAAEGAQAYHEFNLSPSSEWMAHAFRRYREGGPLADEELDPKIAVHRRERSLELTATLALNRLSADYSRDPLQLGLTAVIEDARGALSYWALRHPVEKPDFHLSETFTLRLPPSDMDGARNPG